MAGEVKEVKVDIIAVEIGATITLEEVTSKAMAVDQYGIISTLEEDLHPMVLIWVLVADSPETRDGYHPSVDKVASVLLKSQRVCYVPWATILRFFINYLQQCCFNYILVYAIYLYWYNKLHKERSAYN